MTSLHATASNCLLLKGNGNRVYEAVSRFGQRILSLSSTISEISSAWVTATASQNVPTPGPISRLFLEMYGEKVSIRIFSMKSMKNEREVSVS